MTAIVPDRKYGKCCFGLTDVHNGTRLIAKANIGLLALSIVAAIVSIVIDISIMVRMPIDENGEVQKYEILLSLTFIFVKFLFLHYNVRLQKSTYEEKKKNELRGNDISLAFKNRKIVTDRNVENIKHWLTLYLTYLVYVSVTFALMSIIYRRLDVLIIGVLVVMLIGYMRSVVKRFYQTELEGHTITDTTMILPQSTFNGQVP